MNKKNTIFAIIVLTFLTIGSGISAGQVNVKHLRCEYLENPLGIDAVNPRLSWQLDSDERGQKQTAYRLLVASSRDKLNDDVGDLWDTKKNKSDQAIHVAYNGKGVG